MYFIYTAHVCIILFLFECDLLNTANASLTNQKKEFYELSQRILKIFKAFAAWNLLHSKKNKMIHHAHYVMHPKFQVLKRDFYFLNEKTNFFGIFIDESIKSKHLNFAILFCYTETLSFFLLKLIKNHVCYFSSKIEYLRHWLRDVFSFQIIWNIKVW